MESIHDVRVGLALARNQFADFEALGNTDPTRPGTGRLSPYRCHQWGVTSIIFTLDRGGHYRCR
ncbi:hypothetical protein [Exiguobacterium antarcticum]|uniref:hypothetical protein n=1 Tax=Exiguobacterium antarcticum TaxID=132920 RepID=UPI000ABE74FF|nr:hypothetical protein [Exiguobacterium antarcticum]